MLKATLCCVLIAATAAVAWETMASVDYPAEVQSGSAITYGDGKIWGIFPDPSASSTYFEYYDPNVQGGATWVYPGEESDLFFLGNPAITFQWRFGGEVLVVGNEDDDPDYPTLYSYSLTESEWEYEEIEDFSLGAGASIAFRPAANYYGTYVAGWMYCLAGGGKGFWCYSVPGPGDVTVDGICPGETALIADNTPTFIWLPVQGTQKYKLTISPNPDLSSPVLVDSTTSTTYDVTQPLSNDVYYWRVASWQGSAWTAGATHSFTLEGGWTQLHDLDVDVTYGASLAYEKDFYNNEECLIALTAAHQYLDVYSVAGNSWNSDITTPKAQGVGSAIVTHEAVSSTPPNWHGPWAILGVSSDSLWYHTNAKPGWVHYNILPQSLGSGASLAYSIESGTPYLYLIVGQDGYGDPRNDFYRQELPTSGGGGQASSTRSASFIARPLSGSEGITVEYQLGASTRVKASVFDAVGRQVGVLNAGVQQSGVHRLSWSKDDEGRKLSAGAFFVLLEAGTEQVRLKAVAK